ncbi:uncharacterized protein PHALS_09518 [Plasmopara halstedii]|uniref:Uncharacterized protein n=1 Tax=Plasmopara halstedii TaxID=4781 RepID=A0A0P1A4L9_PLAHL|nr:uncharacterized protein PHALS_09518 [Plasmopara halstedii]CEG35396.1 hypothetical protein PHALS_09518 [Plasmopara halstedii]|eukprot:XP_024571765.1 hypothetical protein PHALS_09518 [Plasmopara halstedii]
MATKGSPTRNFQRNNTMPIVPPYDPKTVRTGYSLPRRGLIIVPYFDLFTWFEVLGTTLAAAEIYSSIYSK